MPRGERRGHGGGGERGSRGAIERPMLDRRCAISERREIRPFNIYHPAYGAAAAVAAAYSCNRSVAVVVLDERSRRDHENNEVVRYEKGRVG